MIRLILIFFLINFSFSLELNDPLSNFNNPKNIKNEALVTRLLKAKQYAKALLIAVYYKLDKQLTKENFSENEIITDQFLEWVAFINKLYLNQKAYSLPKNPYIQLEILLLSKHFKQAKMIFNKLPNDIYHLKSFFANRLNNKNFEKQLKNDLFFKEINLTIYPSNFLNIKLIKHYKELIIKLWYQVLNLNLNLKPLTIIAINDLEKQALYYDKSSLSLYISNLFWLNDEDFIKQVLLEKFTFHQLNFIKQAVNPLLLELTAKAFAKLDKNLYQANFKSPLFPLSLYSLKNLNFVNLEKETKLIYLDQLTNMGYFVFDQQDSKTVYQSLNKYLDNNHLFESKLEEFYSSKILNDLLLKK